MLLYNEKTLADFRITGTVLVDALEVNTDSRDGTSAFSASLSNLEANPLGPLFLPGYSFSDAILVTSGVYVMCMIVGVIPVA